MFGAGEGMLSSDKRTGMQQRVQLAAEVFAKYGDDIRAFIHFHVWDKSRVDDLFQDFFVSLVHKPIPPHIGDIKAYLYKAVANDVIDVRRKIRNHQDYIQRYAETKRNEMIQNDPQSCSIQAEATERMFQLIGSYLSKHEATVVIQRFENGLSPTDMAKSMHLEKKSIYRYLSKAKKKMRRFMPQNVGKNR